MMGSRVAPVQQASALSVMAELMEMLKGASETLPAAVQHYETVKRDAETAESKAAAAIESQAASGRKLDKKRADLERDAKALSDRETELSRARDALRDQSEHVRQLEAENEKLQAELSGELAAIDGLRFAAQEEIRKAKAAVNAEIDEARAALDQDRRAAQDEITKQQRAAAEERAAARLTADDEIRARFALLAERENKVEAREAATRKHAAELAALAQQ